MQGLLAKQSKAEMIAKYKCMLDFFEHSHYPERTNIDWSKRVLIIDSPADRAISEIERKAVKRMYPLASHQSFQNEGHLSIIINREKYLEIVRNFLNG